MLITAAKVNNGVIQIDSKDLPDGTTVTLLAHEGDETFALDAKQESELLAATAEAERGWSARRNCLGKFGGMSD